MLAAHPGYRRQAYAVLIAFVLAFALSAARTGLAEQPATFKTPDDLAIDLVLSEPVVRQPVFINFDERGRLWVVQYIQYPAPAGLKVVSRDNYWRAAYDKVPLAPPNHERGEDKITIHEDTDGDGVFDHHKTFLDGLNIVTAVACGRGGVWVLNPPYLLFYPDKNNDDVADGDPEVRLSGFGLEDTHSVVNSLCWGPDGWLYAAQGSTVSGHVLRPGLDKQPLHSMGQLIWRYHPEERRYEVFSEGGGNAFGVEIDAQGRIYSGHNGGNTRGFHYMQGAYLQKGFDKHGPLSNPYAFGYFPPMPHGETPRFTHTFVKYEGASLGSRYEGKLFGVAPLLKHVVMAEFQHDGSTFRTRDIGFAIETRDESFCPVDIKLGPDGALYVADWCDTQVAHTLNQEGKIDKTNGRIYRLRAKDAKPSKPEDLSKLSSGELVERLKHPNRAVRQSALRLLGDRKDRSALASLIRGLDENEPQIALESLWAIHLIGGLSDELAIKCLTHKDPHVRLWTARLLGDRNAISQEIAAQLAALAKTEQDVGARAQLACTAKRLPADQALPIVRNLLEHAEDASDPRIPLLLWWAIESKCEHEGSAVLRFVADRTIWRTAVFERHLAERLMRRFAATGTRQNLITCSRLLALAPIDEDQRRLMAGFEAAYAGRSVAGLPDDLTAAIERYAAHSPILALRQGRPDAVKQAIALLSDDRADTAARLKTVQVLGEVHQPAAVPALLRLATASPDNALRTAAIVALRRYDDPQIGAALIKSYGGMTDDVRATAMSTLASRAVWAAELLAAVERGEIDRAAIPLETLQDLSLHKNRDLAAVLSRLFPQAGPAPREELRGEIARLQEVIAQQPGTPKDGRELFAKHCARCHTLFGAGGRVGPELTTYPRHDGQALLTHIVDPSAEIREGYGSTAVSMTDGRQFSGVTVDSDQRVVVLRTSDGSELTLARDEIEELLPIKMSLMPEGMLKTLSDQEIRDLFAYLRSSQPVIDK